MKCIESLEDIKLNNTVVTIGKFDGLHKGHGKLLNVMKEKAEGRPTAILTFAVKPIDIINNSKSGMLVTEQEKRLLCEAKGVDYYLSLPLTREFLDLTPEAFIKDVLIDILDVSLIVCGPDFSFGRFGAGNVELLTKMSKYYGYQVIVVEKEKYQNQDIGSTGIRKKISDGEIELANEMLGHPFSVIGRVEEGKKLGRTLGLPTANLIPDKSKILPPKGVYRTKLLAGGETFDTISNVGINPTVETNDIIKIETHILDGEAELYDEIVEVQFFEYIRPEKKFENVEALKAQVEKDIEKVKNKQKSLAQ